MGEEDCSRHVRKSLADARLVEIEPDEFPERIREVKQVAIGHLGELLEEGAGLRGPRSVAHSLGTLRRLEATLCEKRDLRKSEQFAEPARPKAADE